jgi:hypothetical protein
VRACDRAGHDDVSGELGAFAPFLDTGAFLGRREANHVFDVCSMRHVEFLL